ncbi:transporter substrate-binding domain-containing protein [Pectinatus cerevisiiphilus]|uniref:Amino acid ABC transporter substrate-binding protein (PAAT family) n=1 Tax=Pectinatus cerevisiiphilus TaxID=86956 RepID=A0A4R3K5I1_9FIRM|nr:transporter substrate-binding domain-containing protein [Pectinatus cerevisiiphilus]TCS77980.1 amino acid ABC transporter substrate-binding protein (PAAT family) [Pectinatus cerevisiiphilus]
MFFAKKKLMVLALTALTGLSLLAAGCGSENTSSSSSSSSSSASNDIIQTIKDRGYLKVGCKVDVPLFGYKNPDTGELEGFEIDLSHAIAKKIFGDPSKVEFTPVVAKTRGPLLDSGELDTVIATYTINDERKKQYDFSTPYYTDPVGLLVKTADNINSLKDLSGKTIAVPQGATTRKAVEDAAKAAGIEVKFAEFPTYPECKAALMSGRAAAYAMDTSNLSGYVDSETKILPDKFAPQEYGAATKKGNDALAKLIEDTIQEMKDSGELDQLLTKWKLNK